MTADDRPNASARALFDEMADAIALPSDAAARVRLAGTERWPSCFPVTDLAAASIGVAAAAIADLTRLAGASNPTIEVDLRLASLWFAWSIEPVGWSLPSPWDSIAGDYATADGWIKLHTNVPHHRAAALAVLGCEGDRDAVAHAVATQGGEALENAIVEAGGCAARLRTIDEWDAHPQGRAVASEPLVIWDRAAPSHLARWRPTVGRPLDGLRVLDLTRVIAGPVATRFLAGYGADVLRVDPPDWDEPGVVPEVSLGKRCARLDLREPTDRATFERLLADADVIVHGYRADALERLGYGTDARQSISPGIIDVSLDAYGHSGPWSSRRGFDSLVQLSTGIAAAGMAWRGSVQPVSLPVQALDHATGYLIAAATVRAITTALTDGVSSRSRLSLARTARLLVDHQREPTDGPLRPARDVDYDPAVESTHWGDARRLVPPVVVAGAPMHWARPATGLGAHPPDWTP